MIHRVLFASLIVFSFARCADDAARDADGAEAALDPSDVTESSSCEDDDSCSEDEVTRYPRASECLSLEPASADACINAAVAARSIAEQRAIADFIAVQPCSLGGVFDIDEAGQIDVCSGLHRAGIVQLLDMPLTLDGSEAFLEEPPFACAVDRSSPLRAAESLFACTTQENMRLIEETDLNILPFDLYDIEGSLIDTALAVCSADRQSNEERMSGCAVVAVSMWREMLAHWSDSFVIEPF